MDLEKFNELLNKICKDRNTFDGEKFAKAVNIFKAVLEGNTVDLVLLDSAELSIRLTKKEAFYREIILFGKRSSYEPQYDKDFVDTIHQMIYYSKCNVIIY